MPFLLTSELRLLFTTKTLLHVNRDPQLQLVTTPPERSTRSGIRPESANPLRAQQKESSQSETTYQQKTIPSLNEVPFPSKDDKLSKLIYQVSGSEAHVPNRQRYPPKKSCHRTRSFARASILTAYHRTLLARLATACSQQRNAAPRSAKKQRTQQNATQPTPSASEAPSHRNRASANVQI